jgi:hypothetical protein
MLPIPTGAYPNISVRGYNTAEESKRCTFSLLATPISYSLWSAVTEVSEFDLSTLENSATDLLTIHKCVAVSFDLRRPQILQLASCCEVSAGRGGLLDLPYFRGIWNSTAVKHGLRGVDTSQPLHATMYMITDHPSSFHCLIGH